MIVKSRLKVDEGTSKFLFFVGQDKSDRSSNLGRLHVVGHCFKLLRIEVLGNTT